MNSSIATHRRPTGHRGFTLVELLVALGLVSLLMLMFAQVFQIATGTMSTQRGVMENDQRARSYFTVLENDLKSRSMKSVMPFVTGESYPSSGYYDFTKRLGYLSISENDPLNDADDVLSFTTLLTDTSGELFYGKATAFPIVSPAPNPDLRLIANPNQPDGDDSQIIPNSTASSTMAEIVYFIRNGILYRRVLLIRKPIEYTPPYYNEPSANSDGRGPDFFNPANGYYTAGSFWNDFDFSAHFDSNLLPAPGYLQFSGAGATAPSTALMNDGSGGLYPIAVPSNRFGYDPTSGNPREYVNSNADFIGRFTHEETSHAAFEYPRVIPAGGNPMAQATALTLDATGVVSAFAGGPRRGEDILLSNVHSFDVKVWDEVAFGGSYVDIGNASGVGDFQSANNQNTAYGPGGSTGNQVFDTWHPSLASATPYRPVYNTAWVDGTTATIPYKVGDVVIPQTPNGFAYFVTAIVDDISGTNINTAFAGATEPTWDTTYGGLTSDTNTTNNTTITWTTVPTTKRLKSLKITIRYLDVTSDQMRQVTLIQSLLD
jgi:prepilin-type N-terminal cleavage/methylation domain-containing protein